MDVVHEHCAGLDVHKKTVVACVLHSTSEGVPRAETRTFSTMLLDLQRLAAWLKAEGCTGAAMEGTGVYWKPVYNVLEGQLTLLVANAEHLKAVPGRKTDVKDAEWIATLFRHGLLKPSFIPEREQRDLREVTRYRTSLLMDRGRIVNRLQKTLEGANIKLSVVLSDITGVSGQRILDALVRGEDDPQELAGLAHGRLSSKREQLEQSLMGKLTPALRFLVKQELQQIQQLDQQIDACDEEVAKLLHPFEETVTRLDAIPGVGIRTAQTLVSELGADFSAFPTAAHISAWAGMCPGNKASGGKRWSTRTRRGNPWVKRALTEAAWAAGRTKASFLGERFRRLSKLKGRKRAVVAVGHSILVIAFHLVRYEQDYVDLGVTYIEERQREMIRRSLVKQLQRLDYAVNITDTREAA